MANVLSLTVNPALDVSSRTSAVVPTHKLRCGSVRRQAGGGGINVARVLTQLGVNACAVAPLGGSTGVLMAELMQAEGLKTTVVPIAGHTRESFTVAEQRSGQEFRFVLPGPTLSHTEWTACLDAVDQSPSAPDWVVASGSLPPGVPPDFYGQLAARCQTRGWPLVVDTSGPALTAALAVGVAMVKPSLGELRALSHAPLKSLHAVRAAAQDWGDTGKAKLVVVAMGDQGALLVARHYAVFAPALEVSVVSAVGAGDSFVAGLLYGLLNSPELDTAFSWGVATAGAAVAHAGPGRFSRSEVDALRARVALQTVFADLPV
ncbi:MAG: phosphofructokinase [Burkholderiales bacterium PBB4]|nr:MAG: phosphofructokinase [Burkholderiales bacterium PBB4]